MTPDVNVLLAAARADHPHHAQALAWLGDALARCARGQRFEMLPMVAVGYLRLVTSGKVFERPASWDEAWGFLAAILAYPGVRITELGGEWDSFNLLCRSRALSGNLVSDAWIAAVVKTSGLHLVTFDRDFSSLLDGSDLTLLRP